MTLAAVFFGLLPPGDEAVDVPTPETVAASRPYFVGLEAPAGGDAKAVGEAAKA